jgi:cytochrome c peroxidase
MTIAPGDELPEATFLEKTASGIAPVPTGALLAGRRVALFAVPGAYTGVCSTRHVPSFIRVADRLRAKGVDEIVCVSVNDPHVMMAWGETTGASAAGIRMLADAGSVFTRAMGLAFDRPEAGLFGRSQRYALLAEDRVVKILNVEPATGQCAVSAGETLLGQI